MADRKTLQSKTTSRHAAYAARRATAAARQDQPPGVPPARHSGLAVAAVLIFSGMRERFDLPECDSDRAKQTLSEVLKQFKIEPVRYEPIKTVSSTRTKSSATRFCHCRTALRSLGYSFSWQGNKATMKYSVRRAAAPPAPTQITS